MSVERLAYVLNVFPKLSETFIAHELCELHRRGISLRILSLRQPGEEKRHSFLDEAGLPQLTCYDPREFSRILGSFRPQLLHAHFATEPAASARMLAAEHRLPFTFTSHGYDIYRKPPHDYLARATAAKAVITVSWANASFIAAHFGVPASSIHVIPCGVDTTTFAPNGARESGLIVCVARHAPVKNLALLVRSCARLRDQHIPFRCVLVGDGPCRAELTALRDQLNLHTSVELPGAMEQRQVIQYWQKAEVGVLCSDSEGMPVCLMEAAACGTPVVSTSVGGVPELVQDGTTGLLTAPGDVEALSAALKQLLSHPGLRQQMGFAARARAVSNFSLQHQVNGLLDLWSGIVGDHKNEPPSSHN